jgi:hypothetical protein
MLALHPLCILYIYLYPHIYIGFTEGVTLLEFELEGEEIPQQEVPEGEGQVQEELLECPDHKPSAYLKGKPRSILSLLCFINVNLSPLYLMH